jgi:D-alanine-D-alanine ligase
MAAPMRMLHMVGSAVDEFNAELSRLYAGGCLGALADSADYDPVIAYLTPDRHWRFPRDLSADAIDAAPVLTHAQGISRIAALDVDVAVPQMFCLPGMTEYRSLLDDLDIPYLGNRPATMAIGADKVRARTAVEQHGVAVPEAEIVRRGQESTLALPVVVKPVDTDNSVGVSLARTEAERRSALDLAFAHGEAALVESYIELGREVRCGIVVRDGELLCLPLEEYRVDAEAHPIRVGADKLARRDDGELYLAAKTSASAWIVAPDDPINESVWAAAQLCHEALGCRHYSLFDFRIDPDGAPWFLEAGLYCSYSPHSVIAVMASAIGIGVAELIDIGLKELQQEGQRCLTSPL